MHQIILHPQREKSLLRHHPWIFSKAVAYADEDIKPGELVKVLNSDKAFIAQGHYSPHSQIRVRVISFNENDVIDKNFIKSRIQSAVNQKATFFPDLSLINITIIYQFPFLHTEWKICAVK